MVQDRFGFQLYLVQIGQHPRSAKMVKGFGGGVIELVEDFAGDAFRTVYALRFSEAIYVLHAFQKKSKHGIKTRPGEIELIRKWLREAETDHARRFREETDS